MQQLRKLRRPGATVAAFVIAAFGVVQILRVSEIPNKSTWEADREGWWVFIILACLSTLLSLLVVLGYRHLIRHSGAEAKLQTAARKTLDYVLDNAEVANPDINPLKREDIGVNIWRVQGLYGFRHLVRKASAVEEGRPETKILWTKGKGVIGQCWRGKARVFADLEAVRAAVPDQKVFRRLPWDDRFRFTWAQFEETDRYKAILALPLKTRGSYRYPVRGVLAIDLLASSEVATLETIDKSTKFGAILKTCEAVLSGDQE